MKVEGLKPVPINISKSMNLNRYALLIYLIWILQDNESDFLSYISLIWTTQLFF